MSRPMPVQPQLSRDEVKYLEVTLTQLPITKTTSTAVDADGLLKFAYHQNPYVRAYVKVLWSGYALSRGQVAEGSPRFSQARRDAQNSNVDQGTTKALDDAAAALEQAMSPSGSIASFLVELRERTMRRLWSRVCETTGLPPPSFAQLFGVVRSVSHDELDAEEEAEMAALRKPLPGEVVQMAANNDELDDDDDEYEDDPDSADARADSANDRATTAPTAPVALSLSVTRSGGAEVAAELVLSAAAEILRDLRVQRADGALKVTIVVETQRRQQGDRPKDGARRRRRRR